MSIVQTSLNPIVVWDSVTVTLQIETVYGWSHSHVVHSFTLEAQHINYHFPFSLGFISSISIHHTRQRRQIQVPLQHKLLSKMFPPVFQSHCVACETTAAQWARINACPHSREDLSTPGKPYPIPPTFGTDSHPYAKQIGFTELMTIPEPEVSQDKVSTQPQYEPAVKKPIDMGYIKELIANIFPPTSKSENNPGSTIPKPNIPIPPIVPPKYHLEGLEMGPDVPPPRPYVPTPPYESLFDSEPEDAIPKPRPNVPLPPDAPPNQ
jgi:hypothetical protein